ncbi:MAG: LysR family transcriptional regulator [Oscillospiraceae bacterium]|nr:LysR family transcriptional regulator [Oscillospiraceae bacterium]
MNARSLKYAIVLSETRNFSQAAQQLGVSQPTFSKQIIALENDLGLKLFDRNKSPLELTPAGEFFIGKAKEMLYTEEQLHKTLEQFKTGENGTLTIGVTPFRSMALMPELVKKVKAKYPGVKVVLHEANAGQLRKDAAEGICDFVILNLPVDDPGLEVTPIMPDTLVLAVPDNLASALEDPEKAAGGTIRLQEAKKLPFVTLGQGQELRQLLERLCAVDGFYPDISAEVVSITTAWAMARAGVGAVLLPLQLAEMESADGKLRLYPLQKGLYSRQPAVVIRRGQYISEYADYAIELLKQ